MVGDKVSNLIIGIKNASLVKKDKTEVVATKMNEAILQLLVDENFIDSFEVRSKDRKILVNLKYDKNNKSAINDVKRISKLSKRVYGAAKEFHSVKNGHGLLVVSTPLGIISGKKAQEENVGGELMFEIW